MRNVPLVPALAVLLAVLAVATAAAGLAGTGASDGEPSGDEGFGVGEGSGAGFGSDDELGIDFSDPETTTGSTPPYLERVVSAVVVLLVLAVFAVVVQTVREDGLRGLVSLVVTAVRDSLGAALLLGFLVLLVLFLEALVGDGGGGTLGGEPGPRSLASEGGSAVVSQPLDTGFALVAVFGVVLVALFAMFSTGIVRSTRERLAGDATPSARVRAASQAEFDGSFSDVEPTNPVYRAWLDVADAAEGTERRTSTPTEVARAAVTAGLDGQAVRTVTDLFAEVRYGEKPVDDERATGARRARNELHGDRGGDQ